jgi:cardiolipin synthase
MASYLFSHFYFLIYLLIILVFITHIISTNRPPASTLAWLFLVLVYPGIGIMLYIILGSRKIIQNKPLIHFFDYEDKIPLTTPVQKVLVACGAPNPIYNKKIKLLMNGEDTYNEILNLISNASTSIYLEIFILKNDKVARLILDCLELKAREGLDVKILLDGLGAHMPGHPSFKNFIKAGGNVSMFMPLIHRPFRGRANLRNHRKLIVADSGTAIIGGMNIAEEYMGLQQGEQWVDIAMLIEGPIAAQVEDVFVFDWSYANRKHYKKTRTSIAVSRTKHLAQLATGGPDIESDPIYEMLLTAIYCATKRIYIVTPYFIPDESLSKALELASKRGIEINMIVPMKSNHLIADFGRMTYIEQIQNAGAKVYYYPKMIHAKLVLIDDSFSFLGSANIDNRSLLLNYELGICMYSPEEIQEIKTWFENILLQSILGDKKFTKLDTYIGRIARLFSPLI